MKKVSTKELAPAPANGAVSISDVAEEAAPTTAVFDLEAFLATPDEIVTVTLGIAHIVSKAGKDSLIAGHNGVTIFVHPREGVTVPRIALGKKALCRVSYPKHDGVKKDGDTISVFASAIELA